MHDSGFPLWTMLPFPALVLAIAVLPLLARRAWARHSVQVAVVAVCAAPVVAYLVLSGRGEQALHAAGSYLTFACTLGALFVTAGGVYAAGDLEATPRNNTAFLLLGSLAASFIGTTGASVLAIRPLLRTNSQREHTEHLVPFFILTVANAGGLLTPLGDPPLLVGFIQGVPFFWTLQLWPVWLLYVGTLCAAFYVVDARAYARERPAVRMRDRSSVAPLELRGLLNLIWLLAIVGAAFLPPVARELGLLAIAAASYLTTAREVRALNEFGFEPIVEVAILFAGLFACLVPIEHGLSAAAPHLPLHASWQLFWASGALSAVLDNAPTYAAFAALARGLHGATSSALVAGIAPLQLAAISAGCVVMGATTYIGNGPNLMVKAIAERARCATPSFARYALFAFAAMLPAHLTMTVALYWLEH